MSSTTYLCLVDDNRDLVYAKTMCEKCLTKKLPIIKKWPVTLDDMMINKKYMGYIDCFDIKCICSSKKLI
jgi:hypothetical protein